MNSKSFRKQLTHQFLLQTLISSAITAGDTYYNSHAKPLDANYDTNTTGLNRFRYVQQQPVTRRSPLRMASHSPDYFHYHYMQNLRRQHQKPDEEETVSALHGPTKHQILGKPSTDVELSILEDLQRQTQNFTLDETKPVTEEVPSFVKPVRSDGGSKSKKKEKKKSKGKEMTRVKQSYKESFEETRPSPDKTGSRRRTIKSHQKKTEFSSTMRPIQTSKSRKKSRHYTRTKNYNSDDDDNNDESFEASGTKKVFMTTSRRSKGLNPHLYDEATNDDYYPIKVDQEKDNYSMEWDDKYNVGDFVVRRDGQKSPPMRRRGKIKKKAKRESGELPMLDIYGGGTFDHSEEENHEPEDYENNDYDNNDEDEADVLKKSYQ